MKKRNIKTANFSQFMDKKCTKCTNKHPFYSIDWSHCFRVWYICLWKLFKTQHTIVENKFEILLMNVFRFVAQNSARPSFLHEISNSHIHLSQLHGLTKPPSCISVPNVLYLCKKIRYHKTFKVGHKVLHTRKINELNTKLIHKKPIT